METIKKKILIVDDDDNMRTALTYHFTAEGFTVFSEPDGKLGLLRALAEKPDIILLDVMMPGLDGVTVMNELRHANDWGNNVPIILLTSLFEEDDIMQRVPVAEKGKSECYGLKDGLSLAQIVEKVNRRLTERA